jgi:hypothetical protein
MRQARQESACRVGDRGLTTMHAGCFLHGDRREPEPSTHAAVVRPAVVQEPEKSPDGRRRADDQRDRDE